MFERRIWVRVLRIVSVVFMEAFEKHSTAQHGHRSGYYGLSIVGYRLYIPLSPSYLLTISPRSVSFSWVSTGLGNSTVQSTKYEVKNRIEYDAGLGISQRCGAVRCGAVLCVRSSVKGVGKIGMDRWIKYMYVCVVSTSSPVRSGPIRSFLVSITKGERREKRGGVMKNEE